MLFLKALLRIILMGDIKSCPVCHVDMPRRTRPNGDLEPRMQHLRRKYCTFLCGTKDKARKREKGLNPALPESEQVPFKHMARQLWEPQR